MVKKCRKCLLDKSLDQYWHDSRGRDGLKAQCIECCRKTKKDLHERYRQREYTEIVYPEQKKCSSCKQIKDSIMFHKIKTNIDGLHLTCKECFFKLRDMSKHKIRNLRYYKKNADVLAERYALQVESLEDWYIYRLIKQTMGEIEDEPSRRLFIEIYRQRVQLIRLSREGN
jgi:hypothetical protein